MGIDRSTANVAIESFILGKDADKWEHEFISDDAVPRCNITNRRILSPMFGQIMNDHDDMIVRGKNMHEAGHARLTVSDKDPKWSALKGNVFNALEDLRIESAIGNLSPVIRQDIRGLNQDLCRDLNIKIASGDCKLKPIDEALLSMMFHENGLPVSWKLSESAQKYFDAAYPEFQKWKEITHLDDKQGFYEIETIVDKVIEKLGESADEQNRQGNNSQNGNSDNKKSEKSDEKNGRGNNQKNENSDGTDDSSKSKESENSGESKDKQGDKQESNSNGDSNDSDNDEEESDSQNGKDNKSSQNAPESNSDDSENNSDNKCKSENGDNHENDDSNDEANPGDEKEYTDSVKNENQMKKAEERLNKDFSGEDVKEKVLSEKLKKIFDDSKSISDGYTSFTGNDTVILGKEYKNNYDVARRSISSAIGKLSNYVEDILKSMARTSFVKNLEHGKLDSRKLVGISKSLTKKVFYKTHNGIDLNTAVTILIDESGSIGYTYQQLQTLAIAFSEVFYKLDIKFEVLGFTTEMEQNKFDIPRNVIRNTQMNIIEHKRFNENYQHEKYRLGSISSYNCNVDGESLLFAFKRIKRQKVNRRVIFVLSDGMPNQGHNGKSLYKHLEDSVKFVRNNGTEVYAFGIKTNEPEKFYGKDNFVYLNNVNELTQKFFIRLKEIMSK